MEYKCKRKNNAFSTKREATVQTNNAQELLRYFV